MSSLSVGKKPKVFQRTEGSLNQKKRSFFEDKANTFFSKVKKCQVSSKKNGVFFDKRSLSKKP